LPLLVVKPSTAAAVLLRACACLLLLTGMAEI
jgi:hypothetical protein